jgi:hypothetical protein
MSEAADQLLHRVDRALEDYAKADLITRSVTSLTNLENEISPYADKLSQIVSAFEILDRVHKPTDRPDTYALASECRRAAELVLQDKSGPRDLPRTLRQINEVISNTSDVIREAWRDYVDALMPDIDSLSNLADLLGGIRGDRLQSASLKKSLVNLRTVSRRLPDAFSQDQVSTLIVAIRSALTLLLGDGYVDNGEVREFIEAVAGGGAHVRTLSPAVKEWMERTGVEGSFKILAGRPSSE